MRDERVANGLRVVGVGMIVLAIGVLGLVAYEYWGTNVLAERDHAQIRAELEQRWRQPDSGSDARDPNRPGSALALVRIPRFGTTTPVLEGVRARDLARGLGHYPGTALPGETGNFAVAGHRVTHGEPFARLPDLRPDDRILVETRDATYTYEVTNDPRELVVQPSETWVVDPVPTPPGQRAGAPTNALLTFTTCEDLFRSSDRMVLFGQMVDIVRK